MTSQTLALVFPRSQPNRSARPSQHRTAPARAAPGVKTLLISTEMDKPSPAPAAFLPQIGLSLQKAPRCLVQSRDETRTPLCRLGKGGSGDLPRLADARGWLMPAARRSQPECPLAAPISPVRARCRTEELPPSSASYALNSFIFKAESSR